MTLPALNILVVDDEVNIRKTLTVCLETEGHRVTAVSNFQDALAEAARRSFELAWSICASAPTAAWI
jgi:NtrC-family two-component system response regulator AlgB